jgi:hypothetical protein
MSDYLKRLLQFYIIFFIGTLIADCISYFLFGNQSIATVGYHLFKLFILLVLGLGHYLGFSSSKEV